MLEIIIDLVPHGWGKNRKTLHTGYIFNDGSGTLKSGNYKAVFCRSGSKNRLIGKKGVVKNFARLRKNAWYLLYLALKDVYENKH